MNIIKACKTVKPNFFVNDDLSAEKKTIMYVIRQAKRKSLQKIDGCSSVGGKIMHILKMLMMKRPTVSEFQKPSYSY